MQQASANLTSALPGTTSEGSNVAPGSHLHQAAPYQGQHHPPQQAGNGSDNPEHHANGLFDQNRQASTLPQVDNPTSHFDKYNGNLFQDRARGLDAQPGSMISNVSNVGNNQMLLPGQAPLLSGQTQMSFNDVPSLSTQFESQSQSQSWI